jgi:hypothetical protein
MHFNMNLIWDNHKRNFKIKNHSQKVAVYESDFIYGNDVHFERGKKMRSIYFINGETVLLLYVRVLDHKITANLYFNSIFKHILKF